MHLNPIIDYISISVPIPLLLSNFAIHINEGTPFQADRRTKRLVNLLTSDQDVTITKSSGRFTRRIQSTKMGIVYMDGPSSPVSLVQISGKGCEFLRENGWIDNVIQDWSDRLTRFDVAVDIECDTMPEPFARSRNSKRFENGGHEKSDSGETWYVGRRTSDRHARVYRYAPPHPRSAFLRVEYELHDEAAKQCAKEYLECGVYPLACKLGSTFGWFHESYTLDRSVGKMPSASRPESFGKTERWLIKAVLPAIEKLAKSGGVKFLIDIHRYIGAIIDEYRFNQEDGYVTHSLPNGSDGDLRSIEKYLPPGRQVPLPLGDVHDQ